MVTSVLIDEKVTLSFWKSVHSTLEVQLTAACPTDTACRQPVSSIFCQCKYRLHTHLSLSHLRPLFPPLQ